MDIESIILPYYPRTQAIYLFGSYGSVAERSDSDVDIGLLLPFEMAKREDMLAVSECRFALEDALGNPVDLVNMRLVKTVFQHQIIFSGRLEYVGDESAKREFEMLVLSFYQKLGEERRKILENFYLTKRAYDV